MEKHDGVLPVPPRSRFFRIAASLVIVAGIGIALFQFLSGRDLWMDEAMLAVNILQRSYAGLFQPLDLMQSCPIGILLVEKVLSEALPDVDSGLRLFPFGCYIVGLVVFARLVRRIVPRDGHALAAVSLYALSCSLIYYAGEVKQYGCDVMFTTLLLSQTLTPGLSDRLRARRLALLGTLAIFFSNAICFILPGVWLHFVMTSPGARRKGRWLWMGVAWAVAFAIYFALFYNDLNRAGMLKWWQERVPSFPFHGIGPAESLRMIVGKTRHLFWLSFGYSPLALFALVAMVLGFISVVRKRLWPLVALLALPQALHVIAASLRQYPLELRLMLYQLPLSLLLMAAPGFTPAPNAGRRGRRLRGALALVVPMAAFLLLVRDIPFRRNEIRPCLRHVAENIRSGDRMFIAPTVRQSLYYYGLTGQIPAEIGRKAVKDGDDHWIRYLPDCSKGGDECALNSHETRGRCWVVQGWIPPDEITSNAERRKVLNWLFARHSGYNTLVSYFQGYQRHLMEVHGGRVLDDFESYGVKATLYEFQE